MSEHQGVYAGVAHDLADPNGEGRARLYVPAVLGNSSTGWSAPVTGKYSTSGVLAGTAVWVMFEQGDINRPVWFPPLKPTAGGSGGGTPLNSVVDLDASDDTVAQYNIVNDGTDSAVWPNRFAFTYKPNPSNTIGQHLTSWFNETGEFRNTPAKYNTVGYRLFTKELYTDQDRDPTVPVWEIAEARNRRTPIAGFMGDGTFYTTGSIERRVPGGPVVSTGILYLGVADPVPVGVPNKTLIVRT